MLNAIKLLNFMDIKKPQLVKVEAFVIFFEGSSATPSNKLFFT